MKKLVYIVAWALLYAPMLARGQTPQLLNSFTASASGNYALTAMPPQVDGLNVRINGIATTTSWTAQIQTSPDQVTWTNCGAAVTATAGASASGGACTPSGAVYARVTVTAGTGGGTLYGVLVGTSTLIALLPTATAAGQILVAAGASTTYDPTNISKLPVEIEGATPYATKAAAEAGPDDTAKFQSAVTAAAGGVATCQAGMWYHVEGPVNFASNEGLVGTSNQTYGGLCGIVSNNATDNILSAVGTSSAYLSGITIANLNIARSVTGTGTSSGIYSSFVGGIIVQNTLVNDSIRDYYRHASPGDGIGHWSYNQAGWVNAGYGTLGTPAAPTGTVSTTGGTLAAGTYTVEIAALNANGTTAVGPSTAFTTTGTTSSIALSWTAVPNATSYNVWLTTGQYFNTTTASFTLTTATGTAGTPPTTNNTASTVYGFYDDSADGNAENSIVSNHNAVACQVLGAGAISYGQILYGSAINDNDTWDFNTASCSYGQVADYTGGGNDFATNDIHWRGGTHDNCLISCYLIENTSAATDGYVEIDGGHINAQNSTGFVIDIESSYGVNIHGADIHQHGVYNANSGIYATNSSGLTIVGNALTDAGGTGIKFNGSVTHSTVAGNTILAVNNPGTMGIDLYQSTYNSITGNTIAGQGGKTFTYGINLSDSGSTNNVDTPNNIDPTTVTNPLTDNGTGNGISNGPGGMTLTGFSGGSWINMPTTGPSGIGTGGAGSNPWVAYVYGAGNWFTDATVGQIAYRNTDGMIWGTNGAGASQMQLTTSGLNIATPTTATTVNATTSVTAPVVNNTAAQTTVTCATSGTAVFSMPERGASYKKVIVYENACIGAASYTFPTAFSFAPQVLSQAEAATATTVSATAVTVTGVASPGSTGFLELDGY